MSAVIKDGLRWLEDRRQQDTSKLTALRDAASIGLDDIAQGNFISLETAQDIENTMRQACDRAAARIKSVA